MVRRNLLSSFLAVLVVFALTLPLIIHWHAVNRSYPRWDEGEYLLQSMNVYRRFVVDGFVSGLRALYEIRNFRATIHPLLALPGFWLLGPHVILVQSVVQVALYAVLGWIIYLLCRGFLSTFDSVLVAALALNLPSIDEAALTFKSELPFAVFFSANLLALSHSDFFQKKRTTLLAAIFLGLAMSTRPAEGVLRIAVLLPFFAYAAMKRGKCSSLEVKFAGVLVFILGIAVVCGIAEGFTPKIQFEVHPDWISFLIATGGLTVAWAVYFFRMSRKTRSFFPLYILFSSSIALVWFAAYLKDVTRWILYCSFSTKSELARFLSPHIAGFQVYPDLYRPYIGLLGIVFFTICFACGWRIISGKIKTSHLRLVLFATLLLFAIHTGIGATSYALTTVPRHYSFEITAVWVVFALVLLSSPGLRWAKRTLSIALLLFLIFSELSVYGIIRTSLGIWGWSDFAPFGKLAPDLREDQTIPLFQALLPSLEKRADSLGCFYMISSLPSLGGSILESVSAITPYIEQFTLRMMALEKSLIMNPRWEYQGFENWDHGISQSRRRFDYCMMGPMEWASETFMESLNRDKSVDTQKFIFHYGEAQSTLLLLQWRHN